MKNYLLIALVSVAVFTSCIVTYSVDATAETSAEGNDGDSVVWNYEELSHTLTISGTGDMDDYTPESVPWLQYKDSIQRVIISDGVSSIGENSLNGCTAIEYLSIPSSVSSIGDNAFSGLTFYDSEGEELEPTVQNLAGNSFDGYDGAISIVREHQVFATNVLVACILGLLVLFIALSLRKNREPRSGLAAYKRLF